MTISFDWGGFPIKDAEKPDIKNIEVLIEGDLKAAFPEHEGLHVYMEKSIGTRNVTGVINLPNGDPLREVDITHDHLGQMQRTYPSLTK
jgi:hypothetical protein